MKTIVISNQKGGVGKTAICVHLAHYLHEQGQSVVVVDLDTQGNASKTLAEYDSGVAASALFLEAIAAPARTGIILVHADAKLDDLERAEPKQIIGAFTKNMAVLGETADFCVIDTAPAIGLRMMAAMIAGDYVLSPIELEEYSIDGITKMLQTIFGIKEKYNADLSFLGMLPNRLNSHSAAQKAALIELLDRHPELMIPAKIGNRSSIPEALRSGLPVWKLNKRSARDAGAEMLAVLRIVGERVGI